MNDAKTIEVRIERTIPASPGEAFDGWLNPKIPGRQAAPGRTGGRVLLLGLPRDASLRAIYAARATGANSAYLDVTEYLRARIDGDRDFLGKGTTHRDEPGAWRTSRYGRGKIARERLELFPGRLCRPIDPEGLMPAAMAAARERCTHEQFGLARRPFKAARRRRRYRSARRFSCPRRRRRRS